MQETGLRNGAYGADKFGFKDLAGVNWNLTEAPLYEHLRRSIQYALDRLGPHGLPLIGRADWNDCLNLNCFSSTPGESFQTTTSKDGKVAESVFIGGLMVHSCKELADIAEARGATDDDRSV